MTPLEILYDHIRTHISISKEEENRSSTLFIENRFIKNELLVEKGKDPSGIYFVVDGCLKSFEVLENGQERVFLFGVSTWWIGDLYSWFSESKSLSNLSALTDGCAFLLKKQNLEILYREFPQFERYFRVLVERAYVASQKRLLSAISKSSEERYLEFRSKYPGLEQEIPLKEIAAYLGITPEGLSRVRKKMAQRGVKK